MLKDGISVQKFEVQANWTNSMLCKLIKMCPESFGSSRMSLDHSLQEAVAFFFGAKGRYENIIHQIAFGRLKSAILRLLVAIDCSVIL